MKKNLSITRLIGEYSFVVVFLAIFALYAYVANGLTINGVMNIFRHSAVIGIMGIGMGLVCLVGEIDLSVGSMLAIVSGFSVCIYNLTGSVLVTLLFALAFGTVCGLINGFFVGLIKMPAFIVTLATMLIYRSFAQYFCQIFPKDVLGGGSSVYRMNSQLASYQSFYGFGNNKIGVLPIVGLILLLIVAAFTYITTSTKFGKKIYAIGSNRKGAGMAGINVELMTVLVFAVCGLLVGVAAFLWIAMNASSDPATTGKSYEMYAIASAVLGGISMSGGRGKVFGILFGAMSYTVIDKIIVALKMDSLINDAIKGIILLLVIAIQIVGPQIKNRFSGK